METTVTEAINRLAERAGNIPDSGDAMRFSQAACNLANVVATLTHVDNMKKERIQMMRAKMRAKMKVTVANKVTENQLNLEMTAVCKSSGYPADGSDENNTFARWTPAADLKMSITNPNLVDKFEVGKEFYIDFLEL